MKRDHNWDMYKQPKKTLLDYLLNIALGVFMFMLFVGLMCQKWGV